VPESFLHDLRMHAGGQCQRAMPVAQIVKADPRWPDCFASRSNSFRHASWEKVGAVLAGALECRPGNGVKVVRGHGRSPLARDALRRTP
jgi:hypothetical protein